MLLKHKFRDKLLQYRERFYRRILKKPRVYYIKEPSYNSFEKIRNNRINLSNVNLNIFFKIRRNNGDSILLLQRRIAKLKRIIS